MTTETRRDEAPGITIEGVDVREGLGRVFGNLEFYLDLLRMFADGKAGFARSIRTALETGDLATAGRLAHTLKGDASNIGAGELRDLAATLDAELKKHPPDKEIVESSLLAALAELERVLEGVERVLPSEDGDEAACGEGGTTGDAERIAPLLQRLESALRGYDFASSEILREIEEAAGGRRGSLKSLRKLIDGFRYEEALEELKGLEL